MAFKSFKTLKIEGKRSLMLGFVDKVKAGNYNTIRNTM